MAMAGVDAGDTAWVLMSSALVLLMTPGLAFFYGGLVRGQNVLNTMMMSIISMGIIAVPWFMYGFSIAFGKGGPVVGNLDYVGLRNLEGRPWENTNLPALLVVVYQMTFAIIGAAIVSGAVVERMRFSAFVTFILIWSILVYDVACHWVWGPGGWIAGMGTKDFAGGTVVHELTACSALALAGLLGPRDVHGKEKHQPHNVPFVILGAALLWFGWSGFNGGSALAADDVAVLAVINSYLSAGTSLVTWALLERLHLKRCTAVGTITGAVVGLVIITPAAGFVAPVGAVLMGLVGCALVYPSFQYSHSRIDDTLDCFPCHGVSGFVGTVLTGLFATDGGLLYGGGLRLLAVQAAGALVIAAYAMGMTSLIFCGLRLVMRMRVFDEEESFGLDNAVHGQEAYAGAGAGAVPRRDPGEPSPSASRDPAEGAQAAAPRGAEVEVARAAEGGGSGGVDLEAAAAGGAVRVLLQRRLAAARRADGGGKRPGGAGGPQALAAPAALDGGLLLEV